MAAKEGENGVKGFQFRKPLNRTKWENFRKAIYDSSTGQFLGRTGKNWGQLLTFYTIFYLVLAALFAICMQGLLATLDDREPKYQLESSLIGTNPGMGFRPISKRTEEGSLIWYDLKNHTTARKWIDLLDEFLETYSSDRQLGKNFQQCNYTQTPDEGNVCLVDLESFGPCSPAKNYGYNTSSPCVFLKLNKIYGWTPEYYTEPVDGMPQELKKVINVTNENDTQIWISCEGVNSIDKENVRSFGYYPSRGFPSYYFPYKNVENYLSPLIAVQVENPQPNVVISIECRGWAKNMKYMGGDLFREGSVSFEVLVDADNQNSPQNQTTTPKNQTRIPKEIS